MFADYKKIDSEIGQLIQQGAPEAHLLQHIEESGGTKEGLARFKQVKDKSLGQIISDNFVEGLQDVHSEVLSPIGKGIDTAAFGLPRTMLRAFNPELDKKIFADQTTMQGKVANIAIQTRALLKGGAAKVAQGTGKLIPKVAGEGLKKRIGRNVAMGVTGAGSQFNFASDNAKGVVEQIGKQALQSLFGGAVGVATTVGGAGIAKAKGALKNFSKGAQGYVSDTIAPKMSAILKNQVQKMNPNFVNYVENKLKIPRRALEVIGQKGEAVLDEVYASTRGIADDIESRLNSGLRQRGELADDAYRQTMAQVPDEQAFYATKTQQTIQKNLYNKGLIDGNGYRTPSAKIATGPDKILMEVNDDILNSQNPNKAKFNFWRDKLSSAYKETGATNRDVKAGVDALYDDAVDSGYEGLQEARSLYRSQMEMEKRFLKSPLLKEKKLGGYNRWSTSEKQELDELVGYIQDDFPIDAGIIDDLESTIASRELQVLNTKTSPSKIRNDLVAAKNPENFKTMEKEWTEILSEEAKPIFKEIKQVIRGETSRRIAEKTIVPAAISLTGMAVGIGIYRLGIEGVHDIIGSIGSGGPE